MKTDVTAWSLFFGHAVQGLIAANPSAVDSELDSLLETAGRLADAMIQFKQHKENIHASSGHDTDP